MKRLGIFFIILGVVNIFCISADAKNMADRKPVKLNNLVTELVRADLPRSGLREYSFSNPRDGWVFFSVPADSAESGKVIVSIGETPREQTIISRENGRHGESMRWLPKGTHRISVWTKKNPRGRLMVRTVPEIIFIRFTGDYNSPEGSFYKTSQKEIHGADRLYLYYWDFLDKYVLDNVNVVQADYIDRPEIRKWIAEGRRLVSGAHFPSQKPDELYSFWSRRMKAANISGILVDEFVSPTGSISAKDKVLGGYNPGFGFNPEILDVIRRTHDDSSGEKGKFYAYLGMPSASNVQDSRPLMDVLEKFGYYWVWEAYLWEQKSISEAESYMEKFLLQRMRDFRREFPGCEKRLVFCPSILGAWDSIPYMDYKVWLDMQMNAVACNPIFDGVYGIAPYQSTTADPEMIRWTSALYRHYFIEGHTDLLSAKYGYTLMMEYLKNTDFSSGATAWDVRPADQGSITFKKTEDLSFKKGYLPVGPGAMIMKRSSKKANIVRQEIRNLRPGHFYSLRMFVGDPTATDLKPRRKYSYSVTINGVETIPEEYRQDIQRGDTAVKDSICWNYNYMVFKATKPTAMLEISDWNNAKTFGGQVGQELIFDFVQIQPFFPIQ